jgi:WD40 repeat protein
LVTIDINNIGTSSISPDWKKFAVVARQRGSSSQNAVEVFDIATQQRLAYMRVPKDSFLDIAFAADNNRVLVATWDSVEIADTTENRFIGRLDLGWTPPPPAEKAPKFSGITSAPYISVFENMETGGEKPRRAPRKLVSKLAVSARDVVATADDDGHVKLWDLNSGQLLKELPKNPEEEIKAITFSPNGQWLAYHIKGVLHVVDVADIEPLATQEVGAAGE